ncbi:MAG: hypothetical protein HDS03_00645 [Bacteroides sp.]|nr:hypothetical protein [Bacteroides sp.]
MKNFTLLTIGALLLGTSAQAQRVVSPKALSQKTNVTNPISRSVMEMERETRNDAGKNRLARSKANVKKKAAIQYPGNYQLVEPEDGEEYTLVKYGVAYGYSWLTGITTQTLDGAISTAIKSEDGTKLYIQGPFFLDYYSENNWLVGDIDGDVVTFSFPQLIDEEIYDDEPEHNSWYYAMKLQFVVEDDDTQEGWYYTTENQEFKFHIESDGTLRSLEEPGTMIGECLWYEGEDGEVDHWSWQATGDIISSMSPNKDVELEVPEDVEFTPWQMITGTTSRTVNIGVDGDAMYIKGLFNKSGMSNKAVVGRIEGNKITFDNGQYMGEYWYNHTLAYFVTGKRETVVEDGETYQAFNITDNMVFNWDKEKNIIQSDGAFCISSSPVKVIYYLMVNNPYITIPEENPVVTSLMNPVLTSFYDVDEEYDYDAEMYFDIPTVTPDHQILDTSRLYYEVFMDGELFTFYDDEYELPEGMTEMTEVPYGYYSDNYDFDAYGNNHGFVFHTRGFESLGVRVVYKADDKNIYSDMLYAPGYEPSGIAASFADKNISNVRYYDLSGCAVECPSSGIFVKQVVYSDGSVTTSKIIRK